MKIYENHRQDARYNEKDLCPTVTARYGTGGCNVPLVLGSNQINAAILTDNTSPTLTSAMGDGGGHVPMILEPVMLQGNMIGRSDNARPQGKGYREKTAFTLNATDIQCVALQKVRKLTPRECERLQGFPADYTKIPYRNKSAEDCPDSPRYKAIGNSWAVPVVRWIGKRIKQQLEEEDQ